MGKGTAEIVLQDGIVVLRPWHIDDAGWYVESRDEEVFRWTTEERTVTVADVEEAIAQVNASGDIFSFAIVDADGHELLGNLALVPDEADKQLEAPRQGDGSPESLWFVLRRPWIG